MNILGCSVKDQFFHANINYLACKHYCVLLRMFAGQMTADEDERLYSMTNPDEIKIGISYTGPHIHFPLTVSQLQNLISAFKNKQVGW